MIRFVRQMRRYHAGAGKLAGLGSIVLTTLVLAGCQKTSPQTVEQLRQARSALDAKRYADSERLLDSVIDEYNRQPDAAAALYMRAQCRLMTGRRPQAMRDLQTAQPLAKDSTLRAYIETQLGNIAHDDGAYRQAVFHYERSANKLPAEPPHDRVLYQYGVSLLRSNRFDESRRVFAKLCSTYPTSTYAVPARRKQNWEQDYFTIQCGSFSRIDAAHTAAASLRQKGVNALAAPELRASGKHYVVRVGRYRTYDDAKRELDRVCRVQQDAFIVP